MQMNRVMGMKTSISMTGILWLGGARVVSATGIRAAPPRLQAACAPRLSGLATVRAAGVSLLSMLDSPHTTDPLAADRALAAAVLANAPGAFERLVRDYQGLCWHVINRMVRHPDDTRELCQDTFLRVHQALHQYRFDAPLKAWIAQVAYSVAKRFLEKKRIPLLEVAGDGERAALVENIGDGADLVADHAGAQVDALLHAEIERLPPLQRTILTLYHLEE